MAIGQPDDDQRHRRPGGATDADVEAAGKVSEALRHVFEAELKEQRRTHGRRGHEFRPD